MSWWLVPVIAVAIHVLPQVLALLIVGVAPSRGDMICKVLREGSRGGQRMAPRRSRRDDVLRPARPGLTVCQNVPGQPNSEDTDR